jgi:predicted small metal-binding protein
VKWLDNDVLLPLGGPAWCTESGGTLMKELKCRDAGFDCDAVLRGESIEEVLAMAGPHARDVHGLEVTPEMREQLEGLVHDR